ncbi:chemotaxis protein CheW [Anaerosalibacter massiliensis]|uniref:Chemotaxis protein CheW n=1 Tax=Anaerosalibacter massiliensis TaxID=1347392 RepID=A0A9X2S3S9_9FIRM|nr:chemotaxis protein CheW [Anaerosalibacter massiliensis]MCR2042748.1 chemotaxis protein CheW [Anaerosalibacter massiliensis]
MVLNTENKDLENKYVLFKLDNEYFGLGINNVLSIEKFQDCTRVPNAPVYIVGVVNLRGEVIPVVDLRKKLNLEFKENDKDTRIIIVKSKEVVVGLVVDLSSEVLEIDNKNIDKPPATENKKMREYIKGIGKDNERLIILLDLDRLLDLD